MYEVIFYKNRRGKEPALEYIKELAWKKKYRLKKGRAKMTEIFISPRGHKWEEVEKELFTPEEIAECDLKVALIGELIKARQERGISQRKLEELSGVKQPVIARMEKGNTTPQIATVIKVLASLGKKLAIVPIEQD